MANPNKLNQEMQSRQLEAKDDNIATVKWCILVLAGNCLLWTNPWLSWHGLVDFFDAISRGSWAQGAFIFFYGLGLLGVGIPTFFALKSIKQLSATPSPSNNRGP